VKLIGFLKDCFDLLTNAELFNNSKAISGQIPNEILSELPKYMLVSGQASKSYVYNRFKIH